MGPLGRGEAELNRVSESGDKRQRTGRTTTGAACDRFDAITAVAVGGYLADLDVAEAIGALVSAEDHHPVFPKGDLPE